MRVAISEGLGTYSKNVGGGGRLFSHECILSMLSCVREEFWYASKIQYTLFRKM
jgi:hypothetical protein